MTLYIILFFIALCTGMALSVYTFGTGGKRKHIFQNIYFSVEDTDGVGVLYTKTGEYSAVLKIENPVQKYSADIDSYYDFTHLFSALAQTLGEGYALHKQDIFVRKQFANEPEHNQEFLSASYFRYFNGRPYTDSLCYLTITQEAKKSRLFSYDSKKWRDFLVKIYKVRDLLRDSGVQVKFLNKAEASEYVDRYFAMNFKDRTVSMTNVKADDETVSMGDKRCKVYSLVDVDCAALPSLIRPYTNIEVNNTEMPVDLVSVVDNIPNAETVVYHLLPANPTGHVNNIRTYTMGVLAVAQMGRCMGEVAYKVSDSTFLWCNALLRRLLCATVIRHCTVHTGRKPDGNHSKRTDNGGLLAKQLLLRRLLDGGKYRGTEMPKPRAGLGSMDDT